MSNHRATTTLWQISAEGHPTFRCELERQPGGEYTLQIRKGEESTLVFVHDYPDRLSALEASVAMYRKFKDHGFKDNGDDGRGTPRSRP